jgi:hypothetical protein
MIVTSYLLICYKKSWGKGWRDCLRHSIKRHKVAVSISGEGRWNVSSGLILLSVFSNAGVRPASYQNEYQEIFWGKGGQCVKLATFMCQLSENPGSLNLLEPSGSYPGLCRWVYKYTEKSLKRTLQLWWLWCIRSYDCVSFWYKAHKMPTIWRGYYILYVVTELMLCVFGRNGIMRKW